MKYISLFLIATLMCVAESANMRTFSRHRTTAITFDKAKTALIVIDMQNDFVLSTGALYVKGAETIVGNIKRLVESNRFGEVIFTKDWHPTTHMSFASNYRNTPTNSPLQPFTKIVYPAPAAGSPPLDVPEQVLWPNHCVIDTPGAEIVTELSSLTAGKKIITKGSNADMDSYSAFFENDHKRATELDAYLKEKKYDTLVFVGVATDFCVGSSANDAAKLGFTSYVISDASKHIYPTELDKMKAEFDKNNVKYISEADFLGPDPKTGSAAVSSAPPVTSVRSVRSVRQGGSNLGGGAAKKPTKADS